MSSLTKKIRTSALAYSIYRLYLRWARDQTRAFVFVATTGRSGSNSLSTVLGALENSASFHEPYPMMHNICPVGVDRSKYHREVFYKKKLPAIRMAAMGRDYYIETNHQFIKSFARHAIDALGTRIRIIHLVRDPLKVATSFYSINSIPGLTSKGRKYLLDPLASDNLIQISDLLDDADFNHDFYRCLWYWYEVEARVKQVRQAYAGVKWHTMRTDDLNNFDALKQMFTALELPVAPNLERVVSTRENLKAGKKIRNIETGDVDRMHSKLLSEMTRRYGGQYWF